VLKNQYCASTSVAPGGGVLEHVALGGQGCPAKQYLQKQWHQRRLAPGGMCPPPSSLEASSPGISRATPGNNAEAGDLVFLCAWSTRLW